jgi:hypothetical protein
LPSLTTVVHVKPQGAGARLTFKQLSANTVPAMLRAMTVPSTTPITPDPPILVI